MKICVCGPRWGAYSAPQTPWLDFEEGVGKGRGKGKGRSNLLNKNSGYGLK